MGAFFSLGDAMKILYSTTKLKNSFEYADGIYGAVVHTSNIAAMKAKGWVSNPAKIAVDTVKSDEDIDGDGKVNRYDDALELGIDIYDENGKKKHWRLIDRLIEEKLNDGN